MSDVQGRFAMLGREFLTWLWFASERGHGRMVLPEVGELTVALTRRLVLDAPGVAPDGNTIAADAPGEAEEARTSLRLGKQVASTRLLLDLGERHYELSIVAETFVCSGVKLPTVLQTGEAERLAERMQLLEELERLLDGLYVTFARTRLDADAWAAEREAMHRWATRRSEA